MRAGRRGAGRRAWAASSSQRRRSSGQVRARARGVPPAPRTSRGVPSQRSTALATTRLPSRAPYRPSASAVKPATVVASFCLSLIRSTAAVPSWDMTVLMDSMACRREGGGGGLRGAAGLWRAGLCVYRERGGVVLWSRTVAQCSGPPRRPARPQRHRQHPSQRTHSSVLPAAVQQHQHQRQRQPQHTVTILPVDQRQHHPAQPCALQNAISAVRHGAWVDMPGPTTHSAAAPSWPPPGT
jgi:hypothetical protein